MTRAQFLSFDLLVQRTAQGYRAHVVDSPAGQASVEFTPPLSSSELDLHLARIGRSLGEPDRWAADGLEAATTLGGRLFAAAFSGGVRACWQNSLAEAERRDVGLRLRLRLNDVPELAALPWEYLYDSATRRFFALSAETPLVRYLELPEPARPLAVEPPLRVLIVIARPKGLGGLDAEQEWLRLRAQLADLEQRGRVMVTCLTHATLPALQHKLQAESFHILHFIGHGAFDESTQEGVLVLEDDEQRARLVRGQDVGVLLHDIPLLRLVVLTSCEGARLSRDDPFSGVAQSLVKQGIPAVIAMQTAISDQAAIILTQSFYSALADGDAVDAALAEARKAIFARAGSLEWGTPALYMRAPDGVLWNLQAARERRLRKIRAYAMPLVPALVIVLLLIGVLAGAAAIFVGPGEMTGLFNVAVAEFGQLDANGQVHSSQDGLLLSRWIYRGLQDEYESLPREFAAQLWHDSLDLTQKRARIGIVSGRTPDERQQMAMKLADRINARVIIYGNLDVDQSPASFIPEFYVSPLSGQADEIIGAHQLGTPITLELPIDLRDPADGLSLNATLSTRSAVLIQFTIGLMYDLANQPQKALGVFQAMTDPGLGWQDAEGKEILYLFIGRELHLLKREDEAIAAYQTALGINPNYARAYIGLGNIHYERAKRSTTDERLALDELAQAIGEYRDAVEVAPVSPGAVVEVKSHLALALPLRLEGEILLVQGDLDAAEPSLIEAIAETRTAIDLLKSKEGQEQYLASAYLILGAALHQQAHIRLVRGDNTSSKGLFQQASAAYEQCAVYAGPLPLKRGGDLKPTCVKENQAIQEALASFPSGGQ
jgi:tetratricopeptide (TPR) repeat protein